MITLKTVYKYIAINCSDDTYDILPNVTHIMKCEVTECRMGAFNFGPDSHLLWLRDFGYHTNFFRETKSRDTFSSLYGYRPFINPKWLPLNLSLIKLS